MSLEEERDNLRREKRALEEMLAQVLTSVGAPVLVNKAGMGNLPDGTQIRIDDDGDNFVFYLEDPA